MPHTELLQDDERAPWTVEECATTALLLLFLTHLYIPILEPVQDSLFAATSGDQTAMGQAIVLSVWTVAGLLMLRHFRAVMVGWRTIAFTAAFTCFSMASFLWSQDASVTLRKSVFLLLTTAFGIYLGRRYSLERQLRMISMAALLISFLSICFALLLPRYGLDHDVHEGVWVGVFTQKNVCAREMLFLLVCLLPYAPVYQRMRWVRRAGIVCVLAVIAGTQSKTAWLLTAIALGFFPALRKVRQASAGLVATALTATGILVGAVVVIAASALPRVMALLSGGDVTMTGRTEIWSAVMQAILKRPMLGYGFAAFWLSLRGESANIILALRWAVPAAHNGFLEIWLQLGAVGLALFGVGLLQAVRRAFAAMYVPSFTTAAWPLAVLLLAIVYNLDESSWMQANDFLWILYVATLVNLAGAKEEKLAPSGRRFVLRAMVAA